MKNIFMIKNVVKCFNGVLSSCRKYYSSCILDFVRLQLNLHVQQYLQYYQGKEKSEGNMHFLLEWDFGLRQIY